jgi:hypothetical protein
LAIKASSSRQSVLNCFVKTPFENLGSTLAEWTDTQFFALLPAGSSPATVVHQLSHANANPKRSHTLIKLQLQDLFFPQKVHRDLFSFKAVKQLFCGLSNAFLDAMCFLEIQKQVEKRSIE